MWLIHQEAKKISRPWWWPIEEWTGMWVKVASIPNGTCDEIWTHWHVHWYKSFRLHLWSSCMPVMRYDGTVGTAWSISNHMTATNVYVYRYNYNHSIVHLAFTKLCHVDIINFHLILRTKEKFGERTMSVRNGWDIWKEISRGESRDRKSVV